MDPVTGLTRRQLIALGLLIPIGVIASTFATIVSERATAACPDETDGCAMLEAGEPVVIALLDASDRSLTWPFEDVASQTGAGPNSGRSVRIDVLRPRCSIESASEVVREIASDPPDEPPTTLVIAAACDEAAAPIAQVLSDRGIPLVLLNTVAPIPTDPSYAVLAPQLDLEGQASGVQAIGLASHLRELLVGHVNDVLNESVDAIERVAIRDGDDLLIPRLPLMEALIAGGFSRF